MIKKAAKKKVVKGVAFAFEDPEMQSELPNLYDHIAQVAYEDGDKRQTSTLSLSQGDKGLKVFINDKNSNESICVTGHSWKDLWESVEAVLGDPDAHWRESPQWETKKKK